MVYNVHYCLDQIFISSASSSKTCNHCGTKKEKDCCKSETKILKIDVAQNVDILFINHSPLVAVLPEISVIEFLEPVLQRNQFSVQVNAPPDLVELPLFISYCNFRI